MTTSPWSVSLGGTEYALVPSLRALIAIEASIEKPLFDILQRAEGRGFPIAELSACVTALAAASLPEDDRSASALDLFAMEMAPGAARRMNFSLSPAILEAGLMIVAAAIVKPLTLAVMGKLTADGALKPGESATLPDTE